MAARVSIYFVMGLFLLGFVTTANADDRSKLIDKLSKQLVKSKNVEERQEAAKMLGELGAKEAVSALANALKDPDDDVRWNASYSLSRISPDAKDAIPALKEALKDSSGHVRLNAVSALLKMDVPKGEMVASMRELLKDSNPLMRVDAADMLLSLDVPVAEVLPTVLEGLKSGNPKVQEAAANMLSQAGELPREALPSLLSVIQNPNTKVRETAIKAIAKMGLMAGPAVPALIAALADTEQGVRSESASALGNIGPEARKAIPALADLAARDADAYVRKSAVRALHEIDPDDAAAQAAFVKALKDSDADVRSEGLDGFRLTASLSPEAISALKEVAARDPDELKRRHAQRMLDTAAKPGQASAAKPRVSGGMRAAVEPLLQQLNKKLGYVPPVFKDAEEAKQYLHDRNVDFSKDEFWSNFSQGYYDVTLAFLKLGMSPDMHPSGGETATPIQLATSQCGQAGEAQIALMLLLYGADPNVVDEVNVTPILSAAEKCPVEVVKGLLLSGAKTDIAAKGGATVLSEAVSSGRVEVVQMILNSGYKIGNEPSWLYEAARAKPEIQKLLLKAGVKK